MQFSVWNKRERNQCTDNLFSFYVFEREKFNFFNQKNRIILKLWSMRFQCSKNFEFIISDELPVFRHLLHWNALWDHCVYPLQKVLQTLLVNASTKYYPKNTICSLYILSVVIYLMHQNVCGQSSLAINQIMLDIDGYFKINFRFMHCSAVFTISYYSLTRNVEVTKIDKATWNSYDLGQYLIKVLFNW